jgi:competence protein ComEC
MMRRWMVSCVGSIVLAWPAVVAAQAPADYVVRSTAGPCLNIRPDPNTSAVPFDCLAVGTRVTAIEAVPYWRRVRLADGREGWASKKFLEPVASPAAVAAPPTIPADAWIEVHIVDVGQGDGIWIHTFDDGIAGNGIFEGRNIVIDGGPDADDSKNAMLKYLQAKAHPDAIIDALIVTHPHDDHYPGAEGLLRHFEVASYYDPGFPKGGTAYPAFLDEVKQEKIGGQPIALHIGRDHFGQLDWGKELKAEILYAWPGVNTGLGSKLNTIENNASIVLKLTYGTQSMLFMGDAEGKDRANSPETAKFVERILLDTHPGDLKANVLKLAHHGSETSSTFPFMQAVNPDVIIASSGRRAFGTRFLPDPTVLARYCAQNPSVRIYRTDQDDEAKHRTVANDADGDHIVIRTNGTQLEVTAFGDGVALPPPSC